jgi:hypothetical protein
MATKKAFKPCAGCPSPAKCKAAGKCLKKEKTPSIAVMIAMPASKKPAKKK